MLCIVAKRHTLVLLYCSQVKEIVRQLEFRLIGGVISKTLGACGLVVMIAAFQAAEQGSIPCARIFWSSRAHFGQYWI